MSRKVGGTKKTKMLLNVGDTNASASVYVSFLLTYGLSGLIMQESMRKKVESGKKKLFL